MKAIACSLLALASCAPRPPSSSPFTLEQSAGLDGQREAYVLSVARGCGADRARWDVEMKKAQAAEGYAGARLTAYSAALNRGMAVHRGRQPSEQECASIRSLSRVAALFEGAKRPPVASASATPAATKPRGGPSDAAPGYCPGGALGAEMAGLEAGKEILRAQCRVGDSLIFHSYSTGLIASVCDMSKPISTAGDNVFCTMGPIRQIRPSP